MYTIFYVIYAITASEGLVNTKTIELYKNPNKS